MLSTRLSPGAGARHRDPRRRRAASWKTTCWANDFDLKAAVRRRDLGLAWLAVARETSRPSAECWVQELDGVTPGQHRAPRVRRVRMCDPRRAWTTTIAAAGSHRSQAASIHGSDTRRCFHLRRWTWPSRMACCDNVLRLTPCARCGMEAGHRRRAVTLVEFRAPWRPGSGLRRAAARRSIALNGGARARVSLLARPRPPTGIATRRVAGERDRRTARGSRLRSDPGCFSASVPVEAPTRGRRAISRRARPAEQDWRSACPASCMSRHLARGAFQSLCKRSSTSSRQTSSSHLSYHSPWGGAAPAHERRQDCSSAANAGAGRLFVLAGSARSS